MRNILFVSLFILAGCNFSTRLRLPKIFGDNMVLQRGQSIPVWGWAGSGEKITVHFHNQVKQATAGSDGKWRVSLDAEIAGGPYQLKVVAKDAIAVSNIMVGDVWLCSGQSNMAFQLKISNDSANEISQANYPQIRQFDVANTMLNKPGEDVGGGEWKVCTPATAGDFSAIGYYYAKQLHQELNIPIGLINASVIGSGIETWISRDAFKQSDEFKDMITSMPQVSFDSLLYYKTQGPEMRVKKLQGTYPPAAAQLSLWKDLAFDDSKWPEMTVPGWWSFQRLGDADGFIWFRKSVDIAAADLKKSAVLELGLIDDADECYLNGVKLGNTPEWDTKRKYKIPEGLLKPGKNVIAVRVENNGGRGGFYGDPDDVKLTLEENSISLAGNWLFQVEKLKPLPKTVEPNDFPCLLFNGMINPLLSTPIKGVIWYQGESNTSRAAQYRKAFPLLISDWRKKWNQGDFPFYFVQLSSYKFGNENSRKGSTWAELREAQALALDLPNTGMAVSTDIGSLTSLHPKNKKDVGQRLAAVALNKTYGRSNVYSGPVYQSFLVAGNKISISFKNIGSGLVAHNKYGYLQGFEVAGSDHQFHYAKAFIEGDKVVVFHDAVLNPVTVRYGWADDAGDCNLYNLEGFPAPAFRTDNWQGITEEAKYIIGNK